MEESAEIQRIRKVMNCYNITSFAEFCRKIGYKNGQYLTDIKRKNGKIPPEFAAKITETFPEISRLWLIYGEGNMLANSIEQHNVNGDNIGQQNNGVPQADKQRDIIASQQRTIEKLTEQIGILINKLQ